MLTKITAVPVVLVAIFVRQSFSSLTLGTCNLQCDGQDVGETEPLSSIRHQLQGFPGKTGAVGPQGPIGPKGDPGVPCDSWIEGRNIVGKVGIPTLFLTI